MCTVSIPFYDVGRSKYIKDMEWDGGGNGGRRWG